MVCTATGNNVQKMEVHNNTNNFNLILTWLFPCKHLHLIILSFIFSSFTGSIIHLCSVYTTAFFFLQSFLKTLPSSSSQTHSKCSLV